MSDISGETTPRGKAVVILVMTMLMSMLLLSYDSRKTARAAVFSALIE